jgi:hemolysin III
MSKQTTTAAAVALLSPAEEFANFITHGIGLVLSLAGVFVMATVLGQGDGWRIAGCSIYLASLIGVYLMSTLSHSFEHPRLR